METGRPVTIIAYWHTVEGRGLRSAGQAYGISDSVLPQGKLESCEETTFELFLFVCEGSTCLPGGPHGIERTAAGWRNLCPLHYQGRKHF
jgi:hypothetical protein